MVDQTRKRILVLTSTFPRWQGDSEPRFVLDLCKHLSRYFELRVLAPHTNGSSFQEVVEGVEVHRFRYFPVSFQGVAYEGGIAARLGENPFRLLQVPFFLIFQWLAIRQQVKTWQPDVIHAHWIIPQALVAAVRLASVPPILCTSHGGDLFGLRGRFWKKLKKWALNRCESVTVVSQSMVGEIESILPGNRAEVIPMGTDLANLFTPPEDNNNRDDNHIVFVGRLVAKKGVQYLLQAVSILNQDGINIRLTIIGDGPLREPLQEHACALNIGDRVEFTGGLSHEMLPDYYRRATMAVFPFIIADDGDQEGFGLVVTEAMGCMCPVVASDLPAVRQNIRQGENGLLVRPGDPQQLADAIRFVLSHDEKIKHMTAHARRDANDRFGWDVIGRKYCHAIKCVIR